MANYSKRIPVDMSGVPLQDNPPAITALQRFGATAAVSSVVTFHENATNIEVGAVGGGGIAIKWIPTTDTAASVVAAGATANFDHIIPNGQVRKFTIPKESAGANTGTSSVVGLNTQNGLYRRVAWIATTTSASVFGTTY